tara:strand:- start:10518 stop:11222 length:705 start_codon:yes stop_codon:yes gene_type:complete
MTWIRILLVLMLNNINYVSTFALQTNSLTRRKIMRRVLIDSTTNQLTQKTNAANITNKEMEIEPLTLYFYGAVSDESCFELSRTLCELDKQAQIQKVKYPLIDPCITLHIQSGGGALMPTFYVCDVMKNVQTPIHVYIDGYAASAASLISVCGDKRFMTKHSAMLIHQLTGASSGKFNELQNEMTNFNFFMDNVRNIYLNNTKLDKKNLEELLLSDIWLDSDTCLKYGLVDEII